MASHARRTVLSQGFAWRKTGTVAGVFAAGAVLLSSCAAPFEAPSDMTEEPPAPPVWTGQPAPPGYDDDHDDDHDEEPTDGPARTLQANLALADGSEIGTVTFTETRDYLRVRAQIRGDSDTVTPGFKGFHIHEFGVCEPDSEAPDGESTGDFLSAGGHLMLEGATHSGTGMSGDLTSLHILEDGTGELVTLTDRVTIDDLLLGDGTSVIVHEGPDNFTNIPDRYVLPDGGSVPDEQTLATGDAGPRIACGVIETR
ncbi:superoxide dismutase[Cu-Zn] [Hoyosella rhizosphaerae]|nr:superoxide dismutase family protein [Hoyosella rhizosphaerae]